MSGIATWFVINFVATYICILGNKAIFASLDFPFGIAVTTCHLLVTMVWTNFYDATPIPGNVKFSSVQWMLVCFGMGCGVPLANLSMKHNTLGFYQLAKVTVLPVTLVLQYAVFAKTVTAKQLVCCVMICVGMVIVIEESIELSTIGLSTAMGASLLTAATQILQQHLQLKHKINSNQLMTSISSGSLGFAVVSMFAIEDVRAVGAAFFAHERRFVLGVALLSTSMCGCFVNLSIAKLVGKTSPITYQVYSFVKQLVVVISGRILYDTDTLTTAKVVGSAITLVFALLYSIDLGALAFFRKRLSATPD